MVTTAVSTLGSDIVLNKAEAKIVDGTAASDVYPGQYVIFASGAWTLAVNTTAAHCLLKGGIVVYRVRKNNAGAVPTIDDAYDIDAEPYLAKIGVCTDGICIGFMTDQSATVYPGTPFMVSATAGSLTKLALQDTGATSGTAIRQVEVAILKRKVVSGDTKAIFGLGKFATAADC